MGSTRAPQKEQFVFLMPACLEKFLTLQDHCLVHPVISDFFLCRFGGPGGLELQKSYPPSCLTPRNSYQGI